MVQKSHRRNRLKHRGMSLAFLLVLSLPVYFIGTMIRTAKVPSSSMEPTLWPGDILLLRIDSYRKTPPQRGDIIVFREEKDGEHFVKRVIGLPGEVVTTSNDRVWINGVLLEEGYTQEEQGLQGHIEAELAPNELWVMGDNRDNSEDSRDVGPLDMDLVEGKVTATIWPLANRGRFVRPKYPGVGGTSLEGSAAQQPADPADVSTP